MKVEVRPIDIKKWHGKQGKDSFARPKVIEVLFDSELGAYATGLTKEEAVEYGQRLGVSLSSDFDYENPHPYFSTKAAQLKLENRTMLFDTSKPSDFVKVKNMKASKYVANSVKELETGQWPEATHVIFDEEEEVSLKAVKIQTKTKATIAVEAMSADEKISLIQILSFKSAKGRSNDFIDVEIAELVENKPSEIMKYASMDKAEVNIRANVLEAIAKNILTKEAGAVYYMGELIGMDYESTVLWFKDPNNQKIKISILEKLNK